MMSIAERAILVTVSVALATATIYGLWRKNGSPEPVKGSLVQVRKILTTHSVDVFRFEVEGSVFLVSSRGGLVQVLPPFFGDE